LIDFPLGISDSQSRIESCKYAIKNKVNYIDIVMPTNLLANRKYDKIREELKNIKELCDESGTDIRYILEYRSFEHQCLKKACEILLSYDINTISLSTGYGVDVLSDFIIASKFLTSASNLKLNISLSANFWSENHMNLIIQNNFYSVRSQYVTNLDYLANFLQKPAQ
jgi:deoxyribose-phosphate aldolase